MNDADEAAACVLEKGRLYYGAHGRAATPHPKGYKVPPTRKCDGTMLLRVNGSSSPPERVPLPEWLRVDKSTKRSAPKLHPLGYQIPKPRKDDGTMLLRVNGLGAPAVRIPTPDNFRIVHFPRLEREALSVRGPAYCPVVEAAWREYHERERASAAERAA